MAKTYEYGPFVVEVALEQPGSGSWGGRNVTVTNKFGEVFKGTWYTGSSLMAARMAILDLARALQYPQAEPDLVEAAQMFGPELIEAAEIVGEIKADYESRYGLDGKNNKSTRQSEKTTVGVDTGMLLVVDPSYLFSQDEWENVINPLAIKYGKNWPRAVLEVLAERTGNDIPKLAAIMSTCGDNVFDVRMKDRRIQIDTNCP